MENELKVKGVGLKEFFINCFWKPDGSIRVSEKSTRIVSAKVSGVKYREASEESFEIAKIWEKTLENIDKKEKSMRSGGQIPSKSEARKNSRTNSLKKMEVQNSQKKKESVIQQEEENKDREREE